MKFLTTIPPNFIEIKDSDGARIDVGLLSKEEFEEWLIKQCGRIRDNYTKRKNAIEQGTLKK